MFYGIPVIFRKEQICLTRRFCFMSRYMLVPALFIQTDQSQTPEVNNISHGRFRVRKIDFHE